MEESMMADSICKKLDDYWQILDTFTTILTILNPSSKLLTFSFEDQRDTAINQLRSKMVLYTPSQDLSNSNDIVSKDTSARSFFGHIIILPFREPVFQVNKHFQLHHILLQKFITVLILKQLVLLYI